MNSFRTCYLFLELSFNGLYWYPSRICKDSFLKIRKSLFDLYALSFFCDLDASKGKFAYGKGDKVTQSPKLISLKPKLVSQLIIVLRSCEAGILTEEFFEER